MNLSLSLNFLLFALELLIIQPNTQSIPYCQKNYELLDIYQNNPDYFLNLVEESKSTEGNTFYF